MSKLYLIFGVHNHQPVGNFDHIFLKAYQECYFPFFKTLAKYTKIRCNTHISGPLWDWILENKKAEFMPLLKSLRKNNQVEFLGGGYYEPILPIIPEEDCLNQIELMSKFLKKEFGQAPRGIWLTERVWEPGIASTIRKAGIEFTLVDDAHFRYAGLVSDEITGYYHTENLGKPLYIFPISKTLRYKIPFSEINETKEILKNLKERFPDQIITIVDDGEKFGIWPNTYDWVYNKGWLEKFFRLLEDCSDWIETLTFSQALGKFSSQGIIYLPTASYDEMMEWSLEPQAHRLFEDVRKNALERNPQAITFLRGGFFRNFFRKYPDINYMHKRMISLSNAINSQLRNPKEKEILKSLFKAQCNCAYWHGIFGGFYLGHLRTAVYENLILAEKLSDEELKKSLTYKEEDIDLDGKKEIILKNKSLILEIAPHRGGCLEEISSKEFNFNFSNAFTRREENYHGKLNEKPAETSGDKAKSIHNVLAIKERGLEKLLIYDPYRKVSLIDHLIDKQASVDDIEIYKGVRNFALDNYSYRLKKDTGKIKLTLENKNENFEIAKSLILKKTDSQVNFDYYISIKDKNILKNKNFAVEFNLFVLGVDSSYLRINNRDNLSIKEKALVKNVKSLEIVDEYKKSNVKFALGSLNLAVIPVFSVSSSEGGFEKNLQQICIFFIKELEKESEFDILLNISKT
ncbi:MAG: DUF1926 domain-containing protein [Candidatus Omnitrophica bacterium]|nr:DUF1926 domain-containing protein [Candidatus Omnitrophota bacterium]